MPERAEGEISAQGALRVLRRRVWVIVGCAILVAVVAGGITRLTRTIDYSASSSVLLDNGAQASGAVVDADLATGAALSKVGQVARQTAHAVGSGLSTNDVSHAVAVSPDSNVLTITATESSRGLAKRLANSFAREYIRFLRRISNFQPEVAAKLVTKAHTTTTLTSSRSSSAAAIGFVLGLLLGLGLALVAERLDPRTREPEDQEVALGAPLLGAIPKAPGLSSDHRPLEEIPAAVMETLHVIRANLDQRLTDRATRMVMVAAAAPEAGSSMVAVGLAAATAQVGRRVLLIDGDLRAPSLDRVAGLSSDRPGLVHILEGNASLEGAVRRIEIASAAETSAPAPAGFDLVPAGSTVSIPQPLIESSRTGDLLRRVRSTYELVVIDVPPPTEVSDAAALIEEVDGVIVVGRLDRDTREELHSTRERLDQFGAQVLGVIANFATPTRTLSRYTEGSGTRLRLANRTTPAEGVSWEATAPPVASVSELDRP